GRAAAGLIDHRVAGIAHRPVGAITGDANPLGHGRGQLAGAIADIAGEIRHPSPGRLDALVLSDPIDDAAVAGDQPGRADADQRELRRGASDAAPDRPVPIRTRAPPIATTPSATSSAASQPGSTVARPSTAAARSTSQPLKAISAPAPSAVAPCPTRLNFSCS